MAEEEKKEYAPVFYDAPESIGRSVAAPEWQVYMTSMRETDRCANDLQAAIMKHHKGKNASADIDALYEKFGKERVDYTLATYIKTRCRDFPEISEKTRAWAESVKISDSFAVSVMVIINGPRDALNAYCEEICDRDKKAASAPVQAADEAVKEVAPEPVKEPVEAEAEKAVETPVTQERTRVFSMYATGAKGLILPEAALVLNTEKTYGFRMPKGQGFDGYMFERPEKDTHIVYVEGEDEGKKIKEAHVRLRKDEAVTLKRGCTEKTLSSENLVNILNAAKDEDFLPRTYDMTVPQAAVTSETPAGVRMRMPDNSEYAGAFVTVAKGYRDSENEAVDTLAFTIPDGASLSVRKSDGQTEVVDAKTFAEQFVGAEYKPHKKWTLVTLPKEALVKQYENNSSLVKMPYDGVHDDCAFYLPSGMVDATFADTVKLTMPSEHIIKMRSLDGTETQITPDDVKKITDGKLGSDFKKVHAEKKRSLQRDSGSEPVK